MVNLSAEEILINLKLLRAQSAMKKAGKNL